MRTNTNNRIDLTGTGNIKKQWQQPLIVEISKANIEKGIFANVESTWTPGFTPKTAYHS